MMDVNGRRSIRSVSDVEGNDWRNNLSSSARKSVVLKLIQKLKSCVPEPVSGPDTLSEINRVAAEFEEKMYHESKTMEDYKTWICQRMMTIEESYNQTTAPRPSNSGNSFGQARQSNILANTKGEMPGCQPLQQGVLQPQQRQSFNLLKQNVQLPSITSSFNQNKIHYTHDQHQKTEPIQLQTSQQSMLSTQPQQQQMLQQSHTTVFQHNQQLGQQGRISQHPQQPSPQQKIPNSLRQLLSSQSNFSGLLQQQKLVGSQLDGLNMQPQGLNMQLHQHSVHVLQQPKVKSAQQKAPQTLQPIQLHQLQSFQKQNNMESMPQRLHSSTFLSQSQSHNVVEQQKQPFQSQKVLTEASSESKEYTTQTQHAVVPDWYDQAYQKLDKMRQNYLHIFCDEQRKTKDLLLQATEPDVVKLKSHMQFLEKGEMFLKLSRTGIECHSMENIVQFGHKINEFLSSIKRKSTTSVLHQNQPFQIPGGQSQTAQSPQHRNIKLQFHPGNGSLRGTPVGSRLLLSRQQGVPDSKINAINSVQSGSQMGSEQGTAPTSLQHGCAMSIHQNILSEPQFTNSINNASVNSPHMFTDFILPSSNSPQQHLKEQQKHQPLQQQKLEQQVQQQKIQQGAHVHQQKIQQETRRLQPQRIYEMNDLRVRQLLGVSSGIFQQQHSTSQQLDSDQLQLSSTPRQPQTTSPDISQHYSLKVDQQNLLQPFLKDGMPLQSTSSPFVVTSPSSPLTPSTMRVELEKCPSDVSPLSIAENAGHHKTPIAVTEVQTNCQIQNKFFLVSTPGLSASPLLTEFTGPDGNQPPPVTEKPLDRLLKAVNSISHEALSASVCGIGSIVNMIDRIAEKPPNQYSRGAIGEDLPSKTRRRLQARNFRSQYGLASAQRTKRHITAITFDPLSSSFSESESFKQLSGQVSDLESTATSSIKRRRIEPNDAVLKEIRDVNQRLVETVVDVVLDSNEDDVITKSSEGTIVRFSYKAVALSENMKWCTSPQFFPTLHLLLLVPTNYPISSPTLVNNLDWRYESEKSRDVLSKAKSRFNLSLCKLPNPMSIEEMAITWDACAREVFFEYAQLVGGERFTSKYGTWEACVTA